MTWRPGYQRPGDRANRPHPALNDHFPFLLGEAERSMHGAIDTALSEHGLDWRTFAILLVVQNVEGLRQSVLAERTRLDRTTVSALVDDLHAEGWLRVEADRLDGRRTRIGATTATAGAVAAGLEAVRAGEQQALRTLRTGERERLRTLLRRALS